MLLSPTLEQINQAKHNIYVFSTLPSQIDYTRPYRIKYDKAMELINSLPENLQKALMNQVNAEIDHYNKYTRELDEMF